MKKEIIGKGELIKRLAESAGSSANAAKTLDKLTEIIVGEVASGKEVRLPFFGSFKLARRDERKGRHPRTGEEIIIAAHNVPQFKPSETFKERVNS